MTKDYRKAYKEYYRLEFGNEFDVHHINLDRTCNSVGNLILLPRDVHKRWHQALFYIDKAEMTGLTLAPFDACHLGLHVNGIERVYKSMIELAPWVEFRNSLDHAQYCYRDDWKIKIVTIGDDNRPIEKNIYD